MKAKTIIFLLLANHLLTAPAATGPTSPKNYLITDFGAVPDGIKVNTQAIQSAIDHCADHGGGTVIIPPGAFLSGALFFKPGVNLNVEKAGILKGSVNPDDYPQINTRWEGVQREWTSAFLNFNNLTNVLVSGEGTIDGSGHQWMQRGGLRPLPTTQTNAPELTPAFTVKPAIISTNQISRHGRPRLICFSHCRDIHITGLHLQRQAIWCLHFLYSQNVVADHLNIRAIERIPSSDGIDIDSCRDVQISQCDIACNDDNIAIKSGRDADGLRVNQPSENITISDCTIGAGAGIALGSEVSGSIRHVLVQRCQFTGSGAAARIKSQPSRGGVIEDIVYRDIQIDNVRRAFEFILNWRMMPPLAPPAQVLTVVRNVRLINFSGTAQEGGVMFGLPEGPLQDIKFENCKLTTQRGLVYDNVTTPDFSGLELSVATGEPIIHRAATVKSAALPK
jgi:polygalacturonase